MIINDFIKERPYLVWDTKNYENLSEEAILESVLNYGDFEDVKKLSTNNLTFPPFYGIIY